MRAAGEWFWAARGHRPPGLAVLVALVAAAVAGLLTAGSLMRDADAYRAGHRQVAAHLAGERAGTYHLTWDDGRSGAWTREPPERVSGSTAVIWLDSRNRPAPPPPGAAGIVLGALLAAVAAGAAGWLVVRVVLPWWGARRACRRLDREWRDLDGSP
ncbi:hypothetical protein SAMN05421874_10553 [Nonomuraea maritima]|uniref:Uncharacterized protein n=1 Tax=Nonomuraea maritima TaxID=683260 RepID=A0A1G8YZS0_9ACTN|nr:hypothetical protein [Nonomuraea maritima]SDK07884.1 hypothetical protein SAMN05421874_10553 [Nonomuraea maritima]